MEIDAYNPAVSAEPKPMPKLRPARWSDLLVEDLSGIYYGGNGPYSVRGFDITTNDPFVTGLIGEGSCFIDVRIPISQLYVEDKPATASVPVQRPTTWEVVCNDRTVAVQAERWEVRDGYLCFYNAEPGGKGVAVACFDQWNRVSRAKGEAL